MADIGAGNGYFTITLADAVGPEGMVYAVDVDEKKTKKLEKRLGNAGHRNVEVILANDDDPCLPDRSIDIAFLCNTYHHIEDRIAYFSKLKNDLCENGRVAIVDFKADLTGLPRLFVSSDHRTARKSMYDEMERAGHVPEQSFEYLPWQNFEVFPSASEALSEFFAGVGRVGIFVRGVFGYGQSSRYGGEVPIDSPMTGVVCRKRG